MAHQKRFKLINNAICTQLRNANRTVPQLDDDFLDLSDVGNEIGIVIAKYFEGEDIGFDKEAFISGLNHGISLTDGTHG